jgi:large subunit ribosomal protein L1
MNTESVKRALEELRKQPKRKFTQSVDLIINLKNIDVKQQPVDIYFTLPKDVGRSMKICAFIDQSDAPVDKVIRETDFERYTPKEAKKLASEYDFFIAQANWMPKIATKFGKFLGTKGKMPSPKLGNIVPPGTDIEPLIKKLRATVHLSAKKATNLQCIIGREDMSDDDIAANVLAAYTTVLKQLPNEKNNIKSVQLKFTMSKPVRIENGK